MPHNLPSLEDPFEYELEHPYVWAHPETERCTHTSTEENTALKIKDIHNITVGYLCRQCRKVVPLWSR